MRARVIANAVLALILALALRDPATAAVLCDVSTAAPSFAPYAPLSSTSETASGTVTVSCTVGGPVVVVLSSGNGTFAARTLLGPGGKTLAYNLYLDVARTTIFGDGTAGTSTIAESVGTLGSLTSTIYGYIPAGQDVAVGTYSSTVTATITF